MPAHPGFAVVPRRKIRNPVTGMLFTLGEAFVIGLGLCLPTFIIPVPELDFIYLGFAFLAAGVVAGRETIAGFMGFLGAFVGGAAAAGLIVGLRRVRIRSSHVAPRP